MKTGDQIFTDVSRAAGWLVAMVALIQKHGFAVPERVAGLINDPAFITLAVSGAYVVLVKWRQSRVAAVLAERLKAQVGQ